VLGFAGGKRSRAREPRGGTDRKFIVGVERGHASGGRPNIVGPIVDPKERAGGGFVAEELTAVSLGERAPHRYGCEKRLSSFSFDFLKKVVNFLVDPLFKFTFSDTKRALYKFVRVVTGRGL
jgi:hypothetical protein